MFSLVTKADALQLIRDDPVKYKIAPQMVMPTHMDANFFGYLQCDEADQMLEYLESNTINALHIGPMLQIARFDALLMVMNDEEHVVEEEPGMLFICCI